MQAVIDAIQAGDYAAAHQALQHTSEAGTRNGAAIGAFLLALIERFDEAEQLARTANEKAIDIIIAGERQRAARWRDPAACGELTTASPAPGLQHHAALSAAFLHHDAALAERSHAALASDSQPVAGTLSFVGGDTRPFRDIADCDDAIGRMLEAYCDGGLVYFPFAGLRRIAPRRPANILDHLIHKVDVTDAHGTVLVHVPLLYACSATSGEASLRNGRTTMFGYLGPARRGAGQRDFQVDGALVGFQNVAAIEFA